MNGKSLPLFQVMALLALFLAAPAMAQEVRDRTFSFDTTRATAVTGAWLSQSPRIGLPVEMEACGDYLLVADYYHPVHLLNRHTGAYLAPVGHTGQDPAGWQSLGFIACDRERPDEAAWLYDVRLRRYRHLIIPEFLQDSTAFGEPYVLLTGFPGLPMMPFWMGDSLLGVYGPSSTRYRWATMHPQGEVIQCIPPCPLKLSTPTCRRVCYR